METVTYFKVAKQPKNPDSKVQPELFVVDSTEIAHFIHEQLDSNSVLVFDALPIRNLYTRENTED